MDKLTGKEVVMKRLIFISIFLPALLLAQDFTKEVDTIPVDWNSWQLPAPWTGGGKQITPELVDINGDGDLDLFHGDYNGYIWFYRNIGDNSSPQWLYISDEYADIHLPNGDPYHGQSSPEFADIDGDGDYDLLIGNGGYSIHYYENIGTPEIPQFILITDSLGGMSFNRKNKIDLVDIDDDGDFDMFVGEHYGTLDYYENIGTPYSFEFVLEIDNLMGIDVGDDCEPEFVDIDNDGDYDMFLGSEYGRIWYYENTGSSSNYNFVFITSFFESINVSEMSSPAYGDLDSDGDYDMLIGHENINYYLNQGTSGSASFFIITDAYLTLDPNDRSCPRFADIDWDGDLDMFIGEGSAKMSFYENIGTSENSSFVLADEHFENITTGYMCRPYFCDIDADDDLDLFIGCADFLNDGMIYFYENVGDAYNWDFQYVTNNLVGYVDSPVPCLVDIDGDSDYDLLAGDDNGYIRYYENQGNPYIPHFILMNPQWEDIDVIYDCYPYFSDYDGDGDYDLFIGSNYDNYLRYYVNFGSSTNPDMVLISSQYAGIDVKCWGICPCVVDIDTDSDWDFFLGEYNGGVNFYRNNEVSVVNPHPENQPFTFSLQPAYPNPFNVSTTIPFILDQALPVRVVVYNGLGQCVATLIDGQMSLGQHQIQWDAGMYSSGVYLISLESGGIPQQTRKVILLK